MGKFRLNDPRITPLIVGTTIDLMEQMPWNHADGNNGMRGGPEDDT